MVRPKSKQTFLSKEEKKDKMVHLLAHNIAS